MSSLPDANVTRRSSADYGGVTRLSVDPAGPASREPLAPGQEFGAYRIVRLLGRGGMGEVYEAEQVESGRRLALKILGRAIDEDAVARFLREGRLAASVSHPNSVYVFGSHDVDGTPAIAMELVTGGTLEEMVETSGPLPGVKAVDAALQIIAGLEAAEARGVLHRDIKPSNCFVDANGAVKVGDYGLSLPTTAADQTRLTMMGTFMGTPAYASPEQVRAADVDVRSDIYSVGATLYFLLTGRPPFVQAGGMQTLAAVLQDKPESPRTHVATIPEGLAKAVLKALEKDPARRFQTYAAFRDALAPHAAQSVERAPLRTRFAAFLIDFSLWIPAIVAFQLIPDSTTADGVQLGVSLAVQLAYFTILEGQSGASLGKRACGLRVVALDGSELGWRRAAIRAGVFLGVTSLVDVGFLVFGDQLSGSVPLLVYAASVALLFSTARRHSAGRGLHELASGSATVQLVRARGALRRSVRADSRAAAPRPLAGSIGRYALLSRAWQADDEALDVAFDEALERVVWIHHQPTGTRAQSGARQALGRATRLRWLEGHRSAAGAWDAYEAVEGTPIGPESWAAVRTWVADLAREMQVATEDHTLPATVSLDRLWITPDGSVRLLDFRAPGASPAPARELATARSAEAFLHEVAVAGIGDDAAAQGIPASSWKALDGLRDGSSSDLADLVRVTATVCRGTTQVSRGKRFTALAIPAVIPTIALGISLAQVPKAYAVRSDQQVDQLVQYLRRLSVLEADRAASPNQATWIWSGIGRRFQQIAAPTVSAAEVDAFRIFIGDQLSATIKDERTWRLIAGRSGLAAQEYRSLANRALTRAASASDADRQGAAVVARSILDREANRSRARLPFWLEQTVEIVAALLMVLLLMGIVGTGVAWAFRGPASLRLLGYAIAGPDGRPVSRTRAVWRGMLATSPAGVAIALVMVMAALRLSGPISAVPLLSAAVVIAGLVWAIALPERGLHDRLARTRIVPL